MIEQKRGRPREVDTHNHYCPNEKCPYHLNIWGQPFRPPRFGQRKPRRSCPILLLSQMGGEEQEEGEDVTTRKRRRRFHQWVWAAIDPVSKLLLAVVVGDRSLATAWKGVNESVE